MTNTSLNKIREIEFAGIELTKSLPFILEDDIINCVDILKSSIIRDTVNKETIEKDDCRLIEELMLEANIEPIVSPNLDDLTGKVIRICREKSYGSVHIEKLYLKTDLYKYIKDKTLASEIKYCRIPVKEWTIESNFDIIGLCGSKFPGIPYQRLLIAGVLINRN